MGQADLRSANNSHRLVIKFRKASFLRHRFKARTNTLAQRSSKKLHKFSRLSEGAQGCLVLIGR